MPTAVKIYTSADSVGSAACDPWRDEPVSVSLGKNFTPDAPAKLQITAPTGGLWYRLNFSDTPTFLAAASTVTLYMTGPSGAGYGFFLRSVDQSRTVSMAAV